jgi:retinol dehydrogenase-12
MSQDPKDSLAGRIALVTGANTGIGLVTARELVQRGARVFIACRSAVRAEPALESIRSATGRTVEVLPLDLGDLNSVRKCAEQFLSRGLPLHLLINNAGLAGRRGLTQSGFELAFGVNHLGHFLLTQLLLERIQRSAPARIVTVASEAHYRARGFDWDALQKPTKSVTALSEYQTSKLANVLFSAELARRLSGTGVNTYALHPGVIASDVWRSVPWPVRSLIKLGMRSTEEGAQTTLYCATSPEVAEQTGLYYDGCKVREPSKLAQDRALAAELWRRSETWTEGRGTMQSALGPKQLA